MTTSPNIGALAAALSKAQGEMKPAAMNATNPFLKNKYADLGSIVEAARDVLKTNGLAYTQLVGGTGEVVSLTTILMHSSGEWVETLVVMPLAEAKGKSLVQEAGSIITYLRRYCLAAILGVYADEDADGNDGKAKADGKKQEEKPVLPDNGKPAPAEKQVRPHKPLPANIDDLWSRYNALAQEAREAGMTFTVPPDTATYEQVKAAGIALRDNLITHKAAHTDPAA